MAPVAGAVEPETAGTGGLEHIDGAGWGALGVWIEGDAGPEACVEDHAEGVLFDVVDDDAGGVDAGICAEEVEDEAGAFPFVLEMGGVDEDELVVIGGEADVVFEDGELVAGVSVEADLADAEDVGAGEEGGDEGEDFAGEDEVVGFLGVDAEPGEVGEMVACGAAWLVVCELAEVVVEALGAGAVEAGPEGGLADGDAACHDHGEVVVGDAADHVGVGLYVLHGG